MGFWSGFESLTGHQPGAFKGFSLKDIIDKDKWERIERKFPSPRYAEEGLPIPKTAWYQGRGRPEMMGRAGGVPVNPAAVTPTYQGPQTPGVAHTSAARPWANVQAQMLGDPRLYRPAASADRDVGMGAGRFLQLGDPRNIRSGPDLPPASRFSPPAIGRDRPFPMADRTTTIKKFADPLKSDEETTVIKDKVQGGPAYNRHPPNFMMRTGVMGEDYFGRPPTSIMNMNRNIFAVDPDERRRRLAEVMRARRGY